MPIADRYQGGTQRPSRSCSGFTMVELLVSLLIIGVLLALTVTAVGMAREASRRSECVDRLRQLVLAMHQFEAAQQELPQANTGRDGVLGFPRGLPVGHSSGYWRLLPYFGYESLAQEVRFVQFQGANRETTEFMAPETRVQLNLLLCPSDSVAEGTNYRFCGGSNPTCFPLPELPSSLRPNGPFGIAMKTRLAAVRGGTSGTAAFSERLKAPMSGVYDHRAHIWGSRVRGEFETAEIDHALLWSLGSALGTAEPSSYTPLAGRSWHGGGKHFTIYDHVFPPNSPMPAISAGSSGARTIEITGAVPPTSRHSGGVNTAILDGSVRFVTDSIDLEAWQRLGSVEERP